LEVIMDNRALAAAFNSWMDDYTKHPEKFERVEETAMRHLNERLDGAAPTYGDTCAAVLLQYIDEQAVSAAPGPVPGKF
jgi:hypothetical protein